MCSHKRLLVRVSIISSFCILSIISVSLLIYTGKLYGGADLLFHIKRTYELSESISHGNIFPLLSFNQFHGSTVMILYPYINLIPLAILFLFSKSLIFSVYIWVLLNIFISLICCFYCSLKFSKSIFISYTFSVIYSFSILFLSYIFFDSDFGVITTLSFLPLVIFGAFNLLLNDKYLELSIGIICIAFSHILSIFIILSYIILCTIFNYKFVTKRIITSIMKLIILVGCITSMIWVPVVFMSLKNIGNVSSVGFPILKGTPWIFLLKEGMLNHITYSLSIFAILGIPVSVIFYKKMDNVLKQMLWISIIFIFICSTSFPWMFFHYSILQVVRIFQFSWRFYIIPQILLCYLFSYCINKFIRPYNLKSVIVIISILLSIIIQIYGQHEIIKLNSNEPILTSSYVNKIRYGDLFKIQHIHGLTRPKYILSGNEEDNIKRLDGNGTPYFKDYYSQGAIKYLSLINRNYIFNHGNKLMRLKNIGYNKFQFYSQRRNLEARLPLLCYNNENLEIHLNGSKINYSKDKGVIKIKDIKRGENIITVKYMQPKVESLLKYILFIIGIIYIFILGLQRLEVRRP